MPDDIAKFEQMRTEGASPREVCLAIQQDGRGGIETIRILRTMFGFNLAEAKQVFVTADGTYPSLAASQEALIEPLRLALEWSEDDPEKPRS